MKIECTKMFTYVLFAHYLWPRWSVWHPFLPAGIILPKLQHLLLRTFGAYLVDYFAYCDQRIASFVAVVVNFVGRDSSSWGPWQPYIRTLQAWPPSPLKSSSRASIRLRLKNLTKFRCLVVCGHWNGKNSEINGTYFNPCSTSINFL